MVLMDAQDVVAVGADGEIYARAGGSPDHAALAAVVIRLLGSNLPPGWRVFTSDLRVRIQSTGLSTYPDAAVVCGRTQRAPDDALERFS
jgi:Uma2 family endonuclease